VASSLANPFSIAPVCPAALWEDQRCRGGCEESASITMEKGVTKTVVGVHSLERLSLKRQKAGLSTFRKMVMILQRKRGI
jgi:hypothetical protein